VQDGFSGSSLPGPDAKFCRVAQESLVLNWVLFFGGADWPRIVWFWPGFCFPGGPPRPARPGNRWF